MSGILEPLCFGRSLLLSRIHGKPKTHTRPVIVLHGVACLSCHDCAAVKPEAEFDASSNGGRSPYCKPCRAVRQAEYRAKRKAAR